MKFQGIIPVIECRDVAGMLDFYTQALRYIVINKRPAGDSLEWVHLKSDDTFLMLTQKLSGNTEQITEKNNIILYYYTDDVEAQHRFMSAKGLEISRLSTTEYGMTEFFLHDPEGNKLAVGQRYPKN